jgi:hypothetical protein
VRRLVDALRRTAFRKGVAGTSKGWFALWAGIGAARFVKGRLDREPVVVDRIVLRPGETVEIRDLGVTWGEVKAKR